MLRWFRQEGRRQVLNETQLPVREEEELLDKKETAEKQPKQSSAPQLDDQLPPYASNTAAPLSEQYVIGPGLCKDE